MGIQINGNTDTISAVDGGLTVSGASLGSASASSLNISGIVTASGGFSGNVTGNLTGTASTATVAATAYGLSGSPNIEVRTIVSTSLNVSGVVTATSFNGSGANLTGIATVSNGELRSVQYYTSSGSHTWTKPTGLKRVRVYVTGGGGGGRGNISNGGTGGGGGGTAIKVIEAASLGSTETVTVGAAGAAGNNTNAGVNAGDGGTSSFGSHCSATGGSGGDVGGGGRYIRGGSGSGGDLNLKGGGVVCSSTAISQAGTPGGDSFWSGGGGSGKNDITYTQSDSGNAGSGGGGATGGTYVGAGSAGGTGVVVVEEFY